MSHILLVDDDSLMRSSLRYSLERAGYRVSAMPTAEDGLAVARTDHPDLVLIDLDDRQMRGVEALYQLGVQRGLPVIFVAAHSGDLEQLSGFKVDAGNLVIKPFDTDLLVARLRVILHPEGECQVALAPATPMEQAVT